jgi:hypothetical protein
VAVQAPNHTGDSDDVTILHGTHLIGVSDNWRTGGGAPTNLLTESVTLADTVCPQLPR